MCVRTPCLERQRTEWVAIWERECGSNSDWELSPVHVFESLTEFTLCFKSNAGYRLGRSKRGRARRREAGPFPPDNAIISAPLVRNAGFYRLLPSSRRQPKSLRPPPAPPPPTFPKTMQHIYPSHQDWQICQIGQFPGLSIFNPRAENMALSW